VTHPLHFQAIILCTSLSLNPYLHFFILLITNKKKFPQKPREHPTDTDSQIHPQSFHFLRIQIFSFLLDCLLFILPHQKILWGDKASNKKTSSFSFSHFSFCMMDQKVEMEIYNGNRKVFNAFFAAISFQKKK
jgi:hypothetical protein